MQSIGEEAFHNCGGLQSIKLPSSVTKISDETFSNCFNLQSIYIPSSVMSIGEKAFHNCSELQIMEIPSSVTSIGDGALYNLKKLYYGGTKEEWDNIKIGETANLASVEIYYYSASEPENEAGYDPDLHYWYRDGDEIKIWE